MMHDLLRQWGFTSPDGTTWTGGGFVARVDAHPDLTAAVSEAARDVRWADLARDRWNFSGLRTGRDEALSDAHGKNLKTAFNKGRWNVIQCDGIHTPYRQYQKAGGGPYLSSLPRWRLRLGAYTVEVPALSNGSRRP